MPKPKEPTSYFEFHLWAELELMLYRGAGYYFTSQDQQFVIWAYEHDYSPEWAGRYLAARRLGITAEELTKDV